MRSVIDHTATREELDAFLSSGKGPRRYQLRRYGVHYPNILFDQIRQNKLVLWRHPESGHIHVVRCRIDNTSSYYELLVLLATGVDAEGRPIDIRTFDSVSVKTRRDLYRELNSKDVILERDLSGRILRHAWSVWVMIHDPLRKIAWFELQRRYPNGKVIKKVQPFTVRETHKRDEEPNKAAKRGLEQELGLEVDLNDFVLCNPTPGFDERYERHESTVYYGVVSVAFTMKYELVTMDDPPLLPLEGDFERKDYDGNPPNERDDNWVALTYRASAVSEHYPYD